VSPADIFVIAIVTLAGLIAFSLGFVRVVLALLGWVGAAFATLYGFRFARPIAHEWISIGFLADAVAGICIFLIALVILTFISHAIGRRVRDSSLSALDRSVGLILGFFIGGALVSLAYLGVIWAGREDWVSEARTRPLLVWGAATLQAAAPPEWQGNIPVQDGAALRRRFEELVEPATKSPAPAAKEGYTDQQRREMDRLIKGQN